jgi:hypothetical protein
MSGPTALKTPQTTWSYMATTAAWCWSTTPAPEVIVLATTVSKSVCGTYCHHKPQRTLDDLAVISTQMKRGTLSLVAQQKVYDRYKHILHLYKGLLWLEKVWPFIYMRDCAMTGTHTHTHTCCLLLSTSAAYCCWKLEIIIDAKCYDCSLVVKTQSKKPPTWVPSHNSLGSKDWSNGPLALRVWSDKPLGLPVQLLGLGHSKAQNCQHERTSAPLPMISIWVEQEDPS